MEALGLNLGYLIVQILMFIIVFVTLKKWAYGPMLNMLEKRKKTIAQGLEDAQIASEARANAEKEAEKIIADARSQAAQIIRQATEQAESAGREIRSGIDAEAAKARETAAAELEQERNRILGEIRGQVAALAIASTQKLIGETLDEKRQHALLDEFFSGVKSGKVIVLEKAIGVKGSGAEVTSALPLSAAEQDTVKKDVLSKLGGSAAVSFKVDPSILGGLIIKVGDQILDGSVSGQLQNLRQNLN
ncbi:MAG: F0F1 ATP synthase subunit B [Leptolinea sp.]|nr:F0F1 ATP synthase subunit B [Leptolinea sp.]